MQWSAKNVEQELKEPQIVQLLYNLYIVMDCCEGMLFKLNSKLLNIGYADGCTVEKWN